MALAKERFKFKDIFNKDMKFSEQYTTSEKITADKEGIEEKKTILTNDAFAIGDIIQALINKIEHARLSLIK